MRFKLSLVAAAFLMFAMGAAMTAQAAPPKDACSLLSVEQVSAVLGIKVGEGKPVSPSNDKLCQWDASVLVGKARKGVALALQSPQQASANARRLAGRNAKIPAEEFRGGAYDMTMPEVGGVKVPKDSSVLQIRVFGFPADQIKTEEKILADCVVETLTNGRFQGACPE